MDQLELKIRVPKTKVRWPDRSTGSIEQNNLESAPNRPDLLLISLPAQRQGQPIQCTLQVSVLALAGVPGDSPREKGRAVADTLKKWIRKNGLEHDQTLRIIVVEDQVDFYLIQSN